MKLTPDVVQNDTQSASVEEVQLSLAQKASVFLPVAICADTWLSCIHAPLPLTVGATVGAFFLAKKSPQILGALKPHLPATMMNYVQRSHEEPQERQFRGEWSAWDRLLGRHLVDRDDQSQVQDDDVPLLPLASALVDASPSATDETGTDPRLAVFPIYPDKETLRLGITFDGQRFDPHIDFLFGKGVIASAVQGSGKSMTCGVIIEQAAKCGVPCVVFDHKGEYSTVPDLPFVNGIRAGKGLAFDLNTDNVDEFVSMVMTNRYQAIVHLPSYGYGWSERAAIVAEVGQALMRYALKSLEADDLLIPALIFLDEAQLYLPENVNLLPPAAKANKEILNNLQNAYFSLVSNGRSNGYTVCFATQSLTYIAKWAIKSCQIKIFMRHAEKNDLDECERTIPRNVATRADIESFEPGCGVVFGFTSRPVKVRFDRKVSVDRSETPGIDRLRQASAVHAEQISRDLQRSQTAFTDDQVETIHSLVGKAVETAILSMRSGNAATSFPVSASDVPVISGTGNDEDNCKSGGNGSTSAVNRHLEIVNQFPCQSGNTLGMDSVSSDVLRPDVSEETIRHIKNMKEMGRFTDADISKIVGLSGRNYPTYKQVLAYLGYRKESQASG